jgi:hypothetical protein
MTQHFAKIKTGNPYKLTMIWAKANKLCNDFDLVKLMGEAVTLEL